MTKNTAASVRARLLNLAKKENLAFQIVLTRFFHERLLFRLSKSDFNEHFKMPEVTPFRKGVTSPPSKKE